jgi:hypothetical protein
MTVFMQGPWAKFLAMSAVIASLPACSTSAHKGRTGDANASSQQADSQSAGGQNAGSFKLTLPVLNNAPGAAQLLLTLLPDAVPCPSAGPCSPPGTIANRFPYVPGNIYTVDQIPAGTYNLAAEVDNADGAPLEQSAGTAVAIIAGEETTATVTLSPTTSQGVGGLVVQIYEAPNLEPPPPITPLVPAPPAGSSTWIVDPTSTASFQPTTSYGTFGGTCNSGYELSFKGSDGGLLMELTATPALNTPYTLTVPQDMGAGRSAVADGIEVDVAKIDGTTLAGGSLTVLAASPTSIQISLTLTFTDGQVLKGSATQSLQPGSDDCPGPI